MNSILEIDGYACIVLPLLLLVLPLQWIIAAVFAACFHEMCHILALYILKIPITQIQIGVCGAKIETGSINIWQELLCALAGPAGSIFLILLVTVFPSIAVCGFVQGIFNLIPVYPLDGGRAMRCLLIICFRERHAVIVYRIIETAFCLLLLAAGIYSCLAWNLGISPLYPALAVVPGWLQGKKSCKDPFLKVQ